ncbi:NADH dehydrogenase [Cribrihabitans marinus]|uniref:NADH dehydrogenase n=1 Tax=Cribrihabitans marinus TaxID=1227549 RepID=A0A1H7DJW7_9RHOB|nr:complex I NDUFA9 subunit family protein [Cribrihabitans marinus]GGH39603.1 3-beta-hydroxy-Delta(5)-steroid dehydrogenase [Cribrihabitans marinus]SEK01644.1 NADH dehydrogenase [Cribrihabitans marinus]
MSKLVTIYGGSGFIGRYVTRRMAQQGWRVRVAVRRPNQAMHVKPYGVVGQVEPVFCNIRDDASVAQAMRGADAVINCVGVLNEVGKNGFDAVQAEGAERIARLSAEHGIARIVQISAIGADAESESDYARTKAQGEAGVLEHRPDAVILRPSVVFGAEDQFFNRFAAMTRLSPFLPVVGADTRFQPVYVDDVARAAELAALGQAEPGIYELGGPDVASFRALMNRMLGVIHRRRIVIGLPMWVARIMAGAFDALKFVSFQLFTNPVLTRDQLKNLARDNVVSDGAKGFDDLGIEPADMDSILPDYLWKFRPSGQYDEIKESARNLRA